MPGWSDPFCHYDSSSSARRRPLLFSGAATLGIGSCTFRRRRTGQLHVKLSLQKLEPSMLQAKLIAC
jgi:hypothetical protein